MSRRYWGWVALLSLLLIMLVWLLPIRGQLRLQSGSRTGALYPHIVLDAANPTPGSEVLVTVTDVESWAYVKLTANGAPAAFVDWSEVEPGQLWRWQWRVRVPAAGEGVTLDFYHDCHTGCRRRGSLAFGNSLTTATAPGAPTKLCVVFADPARNWHNRQGWVVDMTYMRLADDTQDPYWSVDALAARVALANRQGLRVLVRVDFDRNQTLPPADDYLALSEYLAYLQRLARDERLATVYGYVIGSGMNAADANQQAPDRPLSPSWVARIFNGYGEDPTHNDNALAVIHAARPTARVLVGPVRPWVYDQDAELPYPLDVPWLNYMNALAASLDLGATSKAQAGIAGGAPDGFALHAPGRPLAPELEGASGAEEPRQEIARVAWNGAQAGFRVYEDWMRVIDRYATLQGLPLYITATNTFAPDEPIPPAQNYPLGWLTTAYSVVNAAPRVQSLCWFLDLVPGDNRWDAYSLGREQGRLLYAAEEFEMLLQE